jgi:hypothetical protein
LHRWAVKQACKESWAHMAGPLLAFSSKKTQRSLHLQSELQVNNRLLPPISPSEIHHWHAQKISTRRPGGAARAPMAVSFLLIPRTGASLLLSLSRRGSGSDSRSLVVLEVAAAAVRE